MSIELALALIIVCTVCGAGWGFFYCEHLRAKRDADLVGYINKHLRAQS